MSAHHQTLDETAIHLAQMVYERPSIEVIGDASVVVLGVAGAGDDFFGYTSHLFEFECDGAERIVDGEHARLRR